MYAHDTALLATPLGLIFIGGTMHEIDEVRLLVDDDRSPHDPAGPAIRAACAQLDAYFRGEPIRFDLPLAASRVPRGAVLRAAIVAIAHGTTASYGAVARTIASSPRAVGQACARNPFPIIVPCHRVLGTGGVLGPYSAGAGPAIKDWLLQHERRFSRSME